MVRGGAFASAADSGEQACGGDDEHEDDGAAFTRDKEEGERGEQPERENRGARVSGDAVVMLVCSVTVVIAGLRPTGVTGLGEAVQVELAGAPMQVTAVGAVNPPLGVMEKVVVAGLPWVTVVVVAESERVKSGGTGIVTIWGAEVEEVKPPTAPG